MHISNEKEFMDFAKRKFQLERLIAWVTSSQLPFSKSKILKYELELNAITTLMMEYDEENNPDRVGIWTPTPYGNRLWPEDPRVGDISLEHIASSLAKIVRYNGWLDNCYSVAQHSVHVCDLLPTPYKKAGLMHDAPESVLGDVCTPIKRILKRDGTYQKLEDKWINVISKQFDFVWNNEVEHVVKQFDLSMLAIEIRDITSHQVFNGDARNIPYSYMTIKEVWSPFEAEQRFINRWKSLV